MEMIVIVGLAMFALLVSQHKKASAQRFERVRERRDAPSSTFGQTDVPDDRC